MSGALRKFPLDLSKVSGKLAEGFCDLGEGAEPIEGFGYADRSGTIRRVTARYPNGWRVRINFTAKGEYSSSSASLKLVSRPVRGGNA